MYTQSVAMETSLKSLQCQQNALNKLPEDADGYPIRPVVNWSDPTIRDLFKDTEYELVNQGFNVAS